MSKIICDICGTSYPDSSECCPICGCSNATAAEILSADLENEDFMEQVNAVTAEPAAGTRKKEIFDFDEVNPEEEPDETDKEEENEAEEEDEEEDYDDEEEEEEEAPRHNTFVVILLTILIIALLGAAGFIFVRYFLPNMSQEETVPTTAVQETAAPTTEATIPCKQMVMTNAGVAELSAEGQQFLLHIKALPENTTDKIIFTSADESIATVTEDGKITAVSEGETIIYISCGEPVIECPVIVKYVEETVPPTTEAVEETVPETTEAVEETEGAEEAPAKTDVKLKLKKTDIQLGVYYQFRLELDCDLDPEEVTWTSEHPHIATVDEQGKVTAVKSGTTSVTAKYGDQEVKCMVRCIWY